MNVAGIVLAGGLSSRMGRDKAQLLLAEQTLLTRNVALLSTLKLSDVFVSGQYKDFQCIEDVNPLLGPIGGLDACVNTLFSEYDALFVIPVDMPLLGLEECQFLLNAFATYPQGVFYAQATFPMILPLTKQLKEYLTEALASPHNRQRSLYRLLKILKLQPINVQAENSHRFQNSNTPQEWTDCLATYHALPK
ncbi:molybdenum cofactor guanylyltransferase [Psychromonas sp. Urea-02u-13]|uniref:molybdenum cofactor guanylyltransferase n=1 Tax=Psychromonas sp. Urea-02u-13 TaxID=2058326 RepID=UPI000C34BA4B|nr:molybdenum cofactor guanylyltransferase [Psychromonas sp. Urea-02u-13]PKG39305.1 molybdenum cofactor guanylyltransferase [Psychromonas sp. Urea-02u-13]